MMDALDNKCPACGATIMFNPANQMWDCTYCFSKFTLEEMQRRIPTYTQHIEMVRMFHLLLRLH